MTREDVQNMQPGNKVIPLIGPHEGEMGSVFHIEMDSGAPNGWVTVRFINGETGLYAGEEIVLPAQWLR